MHEILNVANKADILILGSSNRNLEVVRVTQAYGLEIELEQTVCTWAGPFIYY